MVRQPGVEASKMSADSQKLLFIVGPTAVGKSKIAVETAKQIKGEIIGCDSMQIYRGLDICTAKPTPEERQTVPYHLIDFVDRNKEFTVNDWRQKALEIIPDIISRKGVPIITGGTGLYYRSLVYGLFPAPGADWGLRETLMQQARVEGEKSLYERLKEVDKDSAAKINPNDTRRIIRALEIYYLSGQTKTELSSKTEGLPPEYCPVVVGLTSKRDKLYKRIEQRFDKMWDMGLVEEIKALNENDLSRTVLQMIGYKEIKGYLNGTYSEDEAKMLLVRNTRRLAKRQLSLFRQDENIDWIEINPEKIDSKGKYIGEIVNKIRTIYNKENIKEFVKNA